MNDWFGKKELQIISYLLIWIIIKAQIKTREVVATASHTFHTFLRGSKINLLHSGPLICILEVEDTFLPQIKTPYTSVKIGLS